LAAKAAQPIPPAARSRFYEKVDRALCGEGELGAGVVARTCARVQRDFIVAVPDAPPVVDGRR
jgi:hypothetical protein